MSFGKNSLYNDIDNFCVVNNSRRFTNENPLTIMMFLPEDNVDKHSHALKKVKIVWIFKQGKD